MPSKIAINDGEAEIYEFDTDLAEGSLANCRAKFSLAAQRAALQQIIDELDPSISHSQIYLGDWKKGEIQIVGLKRVMINRFWCEPEYEVFFPPSKGKSEPHRGTYRNIRWNAGVENGSGVLCVTSRNEVVLIREFKHASRAWSIHIPRGLRKPGESLEDCGRREASEEAGVSPTERTTVHDLGVYDADNGVIMAKPHIFCLTEVEADETRIARDVSESTIGLLALPIARVWEMIRTREIRDGFTRAAMLQAHLEGVIALN